MNIECENAFSLYGILVLPILFGSIVFFYMFGIASNIFWIMFGLQAVILFNIYFFYKRTIQREKIVKLIIDPHYIQMINQNEIQFHTKTQEVAIETMSCGQEAYPAIKMYNKLNQSIIIGVRASISEFNSENHQPLKQPDYWVRHKKEWRKLSKVLKTSRLMSGT